MFKKILVALNYNEETLDILEYGMTLSLMMDARLKICLFVSRNSPENTDLDEINETYFKKLNNISYEENQFLDEHTTLLHLIDLVCERIEIESDTFESEVIIGPPKIAIHQEVKDWGADLLIMGIQLEGKDVINNLPIKVLDSIPISSLIIPSTYGNRNLDNIGMLIQFEVSEIDLMLDLISIASKNNLKVHFKHHMPIIESLHLAKTHLSIYKRLFDRQIKRGLVQFGLYTSKLKDLLISAERDDGIDLIIVKNWAKNWLGLKVNSEFADKMFTKIRIPILFWKSKQMQKINIE